MAIEQKTLKLMAAAKKSLACNQDHKVRILKSMVKEILVTQTLILMRNVLKLSSLANEIVFSNRSFPDQSTQRFLLQ